MAELSHNTKVCIQGLSDTVSHNYGIDISYENNYDASIVNHNVFGKFLIIDIVGEKNFVIPSLFAKVMMSDFIAYGTRRFIRQLYVANGSHFNHRGFTTVFRMMHNSRNCTDGCVQHCVNGSNYYSFGNILFDKDFKPLIIPCYDVEILEDGVWNVKNIVYKISNSLFSSSSEGINTAKKFIISKMIPYLAEFNVISYCYTGASFIDYQNDVPIKIEIENLDRFVCNPIEPSANFQAEANAILDALIEDIVNTNA